MEDIVITTKGVERLLSKLKPDKASGPDNLSPRVLQELSSVIAPALTSIFRSSMNNGEIPSDWRQANVCPVYKKGPKQRASNYRPISLTCIVSKVLEHIVVSSIMKHNNKHNILYDLQHGFREGLSCVTQLIGFTHDIFKNMENRKQTDVLVMDFSKAFDKVHHKNLLFKLNRYGIRGKTNHWISQFLSNRQQAVVVDGCTSNQLEVMSGVPQGSVLGPCLFLFYINDLPDTLTSQVRLFADDTVCYLAVKNNKDTETLQRDLDTLAAWEQKWHMEFHPEKCEVLSITRNKHTIQHSYTLHGHTLKSVPSAKYLGVTITNNMSWSKHIDNITAKANRSLGFLRRNLRVRSTDLKSKAYYALVRPIVEYASPIWDPHEQHNIRKLDMVQRRAARYALNRYHNTSSVSSMLDILQWPSLTKRRKETKLCMLYKISNSTMNNHYTDILIEQQRQTRNSNSRSYNIPCLRTNYTKHSFFPDTIREWNRLPDDTVNASTLELFRSKLQNTSSAN